MILPEVEKEDQLMKTIYLRPKWPVDATSVEVQNFLFHAAVPQKFLHGQPRRVTNAQQHKHGSQYIGNGLGRHLERSDEQMRRKYRRQLSVVYPVSYVTFQRLLIEGKVVLDQPVPARSRGVVLGIYRAR